MLVLSDVAVIFFSSIAELTANGNFWIVPLLHSVGDMFINNHSLCRSNFPYTFRPTDAIFRENTDKNKYIFYTKYIP